MAVLGMQEGAFQTTDIPKEYPITNFNNDEYFLNQHPDILVNKIEIENYTQLVKYYDNQNLPSLSLTLNYSLHNPSAQEHHLSPYSNDHYFYSSGVVFSMPINDSNAKADIEKNRLNILLATSKKEKLYHDIRVSIKKAKNEVETIKNITNLSKISVNAQEEIMKNEDRKLELGLTTMKNYLDNLNALIIKKKKLLSYECDMMRSFAGYFKAVGLAPEFLNIDVSKLR
jgi:outer membrane protein TolC